MQTVTWDKDTVNPELVDSELDRIADFLSTEMGACWQTLDSNRLRQLMSLADSLNTVRHELAKSTLNHNT